MTTEEKARAYDEALERARQIKDGKDEWRYSDLAEITPALTDIFPQLSESEDERIREEIVDYFKKECECLLNDFRDKEDEKQLSFYNKAIAYLEKQKEQEPISDSVKFEEGFKAGREFERRKQKPAEWSEDERIRKALLAHFSRYRSDKIFLNFPMERIVAWVEKQQPVMIQWTGKNLKEVIDFTGKSPKFGEWFKSWEDFENYVHSHDDILKLFCEDGSHYEVPVGAWIVKTPDGYNIPSRFRFVQKPAEWSEKRIADIFEKVGLAKIVREQRNDELTNALQDAMLELSRMENAEWSEEDEKMLAAISKALGCDTAEKILVNEGVTLVMAAGFLESLPLRCPKSLDNWKPSEACYGAKGDPDPAGVWKPSEEQMALLQAVIVEPSNAGAESCHLALKAIYVGLEELLSKYERSDR
ncbi:MAG: hypothetical protein IKZ39_02810 [Lachnospiraceae bacterium]|nr:hypothetical protein [Lachnospiraceae bacterium]